MALMKCPECGSFVSDQSNFCVHCGYPIKDVISKCSYKIIITGFKSEKNKKKSKSLLKYYLRFIEDLDNSEIEHILHKYPTEYSYGLNKESTDYLENTLSELGCDIEIIRSKKEPDELINERVRILKYDLLHCPECKSISITTGKRGYSLLTGFIGSNQTVNRCAKCGYSWKP